MPDGLQTYMVAEFHTLLNAYERDMSLVRGMNGA